MKTNRWQTGFYKNTNKCFVKDNDSIFYEEITDSTETISDRARLISMAPEMLELIKSMVSLIEKTDLNLNFSCYGNEIIQAQNLIKKIEGIGK